MPPNSADASVRKARNDLLIAGRRKQDLTEFRRNLAAARIRAFVEKVVAEAPPLTAAQRDKLATLLRQDSP
jgi:hypothetical protein